MQKPINLNAWFWPALVALWLVGLFLTPLRTVDLWWHLDSGRWMLEHGHYLGREIRSFSLPNAEWLNFAWLFQLVVAAVEQVSGLWGLLIFKALLWWLILFLLLRSVKVECSPVALFIVPLLFAEQLFSFMSLRPHLVEGVLLAFTISLLQRPRRVFDPLWYAVLIVVWANCHASAVIGAFALALHYVWGADFTVPDWRQLRQRLPIGLVLGLLVLVTPNGLGILSVLVKHANDAYLPAYIQEWFAPEAFPPLMLLALLALALGLYWQRKLLTVAELFLIVCFAVVAIGSRRFLYELGLVLIRPSIQLVASVLAQLTQWYHAGKAYWSWLYGWLGLSLLAITTSLPIVWGKQHLADYPVAKHLFPQTAIALLKPILAQEHEVRVWNAYGWGGYLEWYGGERLKVYIDGRTPTVFSAEMMLTEKLARTHPQLLRALLTQWQVDAVVLGRSYALPIPPNDAEWTLVGFDSISVIYVRANLVQRYALTGINFDPFRTWPMVDAWHNAQAVQSIRQLLTQQADNALAWLRLGQLLGYAWQSSDEKTHAEALTAVQQAIQLNPQDASARLVLVWLRQLAGQSKTQVAQPVLDLLNKAGSKAWLGFEIPLASLLVDTGYAQQALQVLAPDDWQLHQQLDTNFTVWLLRFSAHTQLGAKTEAALDKQMAEQLAIDAGPKAAARLQEIERYNQLK